MNNWHRMIWTLMKPESSSSLKKLFNMTSGATNQFWFEPTIDPTSNRLKFVAGFKPGAMVASWSTCLLEPMGSDLFKPNATPTANTERLEGEIKIGDRTVALRIYMFDSGRHQALDLRRGKLMPGDGDTGAATAHN